MEPANFLYPVPYEWYQKYGVRKYGAHGTSHKYVYQKLCEELGNDNLKVISCHLGSGASVCAMMLVKSLIFLWDSHHWQES